MNWSPGGVFRPCLPATIAVTSTTPALAPGGLTAVHVVLEVQLTPEAVVPPQLAGLVAAFGGMIVGSLALKDLQRPATA